MAEQFRLLWTASRDWTDPRTMWDVLSECHAEARRQGRHLVIVHGDAPGGDQIAKLYGQVVDGVTEEGHPADWESPCSPRCNHGPRRRDKHGRDYCQAAGMYRNEKMIALGADRAAAFIKDQSPGASGCAKRAKEAGIPTRRYLG